MLNQTVVEDQQLKYDDTEQVIFQSGMSLVEPRELRIRQLLDIRH